MSPTSDGRVGGRYELVRRIARGGGGTVWLGYDHLLEREVAVKHVEIADDLPPDQRDATRARVRSEARAAARLVHPAAVTIFDVVDDDRDVHLVLELVEHPTLADVVASDGPRADRQAAATGLGLLSVLEAAHGRGIVHRDVKPSNIFVGPDGTVKLTDFGIAAIEGDTRLTLTGTTMGSPSYIAPEQALGRTPAPPVDLWGLGASLYFAVEGEPPFERSNAVATVHAVVNEPARAFERADGPLRDLVTDLLAKDPAARPSADEVEAALQDIAGPDLHLGRGEVAAPVPVRTGDGGATGVLAAVEAPRSGDTPPLGAPSVARPVTEEPADDPGTVSGGRRPLVWLASAAAGVVIVVGLGFALADLAGGGGDVTAPDGTDAPAEDAPADDTDADPPADAGEDDEAATEQVSDEFGPALEEADPPDDWVAVSGDGYTVRAPGNWEQTTTDRGLLQLRDPETRAYIRVDATDAPNADPVDDRVRFSEVLAGQFSAYEQIGDVEPVTVRGAPGALLEYTYTDGGADLRAYNLTFLSEDRESAYALNLQSHAGDWDEVSPRLGEFLGGFEPG